MIERTTMKEYYSNTGLLKRVIYEPNDPNTYEKSFDYDDYGNLVIANLSAQGMTTRTNTNEYTLDGRFLEDSYNALSQNTHYTYYINTGNQKSVRGPNGLVTTYYYDGFGRNNKIVAPDKKETHIVKRWADAHPDIRPNALYYTWEQTSGQPENIIFYDKQGRALRQVSTGFNGDKIYTDNDYYSTANLIGLVEKVSHPYFSSEQQYYTTYSYDELRRKHIITAPNGTTTTFDYGVKEMTTIVVDGTETRIKKNVLDAAGRLKFSKDETNNQTVNNKYYSNGLLKETWVNGHEDTKIYYSYDIFGNLETLIDPNKGTIINTYNAFGELVAKLDENSNLTQFDYDALGRIKNRNETFGNATWFYDTQTNGIGKLHYVTYDFYDPNGIGSSSKEEYFYDNLGRVTKTDQTINNETLSQNIIYDIYSRPKSTIYPSGFKLINSYNDNGYLYKISSDDPQLRWSATGVNSVGKITHFSLGQNVSSIWEYDPENYRIQEIRSGKNTINDLQNLSYSWEGMGNLDHRQDHNKNLIEDFTYDNFDRLTHCYFNGSQQLGQTYSATGNITNKSDVRDYQYGLEGAGPNAVSRITDPVSSSLYEDQEVNYTTFDKIVKVAQGEKELKMAYNSNHNRIKQLIDHGNGKTTSKTYFGSGYEKIEYDDGTSKEVHYLSSPNGVFAILTIDDLGNKEINYILKDHLGSINLVLDYDGNIVEEVNYDAWGSLRNPNTWTYSEAPMSTLFDRGYTMHEHLYDFDLINMNGRVFDPVIARFLSPDPIIQDPNNTQNHNRYSYCLNNPLKYTDPSGYSVIGDIFNYAISSLFIPLRPLGEANEWFNEVVLNGSPNPNGYFDLNYILTGDMPAPPPGYISLFESFSGVSYGSQGFTSADGTVYSNDDLINETWARYAFSKAVEEEGDYTSFEVWEEWDRYSWVETPGMSFNPPPDGDPKDDTFVGPPTLVETFSKTVEFPTQKEMIENLKAWSLLAQVEMHGAEVEVNGKSHYYILPAHYEGPHGSYTNTMGESKYTSALLGPGNRLRIYHTHLTENPNSNPRDNYNALTNSPASSFVISLESSMVYYTIQHNRISLFDANNFKAVGTIQDLMNGAKY